MRNVLSLGAVLAMLGAVLWAVPAGAEFEFETDLTTAIELTDEVIEVTFNGDQRGAKVETANLAGFPTAGSSYLILSTGRASDFTQPNFDDNRTLDLDGADGADGEDQTQLTIRLDRPDGATCFAFDFRFFTEEYEDPGSEFYSERFNDAFTAEIVDSDLSVVNENIVTPWNFAYDDNNNPITVQTVAGLAIADETTFDAYTPLLTATTPAELNSRGDVLITLTIQDVGDSVYDSAVAIDNARWLYNQTCNTGITGGDRDGDALPDAWEENGLDIDNDGIIDLDLPALGANPDRKDIFLEIDWMVYRYCTVPESAFTVQIVKDKCSTDDGRFKPSAAALADVVEVFANAPVPNPDGTTGITLHIDAGPDSIKNHKLGTTWGNQARGNKIRFDFYANSNSFGPFYDWTEFDAIKNARFDEALNRNLVQGEDPGFDDIRKNFEDVRRDVFHYAVYGNLTEINQRSSGIARGIGGSDFLVTQGALGCDSLPCAGFSVRQERGTLMHELGHNLGLRHGGSDDELWKPNYLSIMNYSYQLTGLRQNSVDGTLDYSDFTLDTLDEEDLDETIGLGPDNLVDSFGTYWWCPNQTENATDNAANAIDWNCDGDTTDTSVRSDITRGPKQQLETLTQLAGFDDWENLIFHGGPIGALGNVDLPTLTANEELSVEMAEEAGVLTGDHDALLVVPGDTPLLPDSGDRPLVTELRNIGKRSDTYTISIDNNGLDITQTTPTPSLAPNTSTDLGLTINTTGLTPGTYNITINITSNTLNTTIATRPTTITVLDPNGSTTNEDLRNLRELLETLPAEERPINSDELIDTINDHLDTPPPTPTKARPLIQHARTTLATLEPTPAATLAIEGLDHALTTTNWKSDNVLHPKRGDATFTGLRQATRYLKDTEPTHTIQPIINNLTTAAEHIVTSRRNRLNNKRTAPTAVAKADELITKAQRWQHNGHPRRAIRTYQAAWQLLRPQNLNQGPR
ncbi:MAG: choice-of-anchor L domain-containing protein [Actinomycetota bacterium]